MPAPVATLSVGRVLPQEDAARAYAVVGLAKAALRDAGVRFNPARFPFPMHHAEMRNRLRGAMSARKKSLTHREIADLLIRWSIEVAGPEAYAWQAVNVAVEAISAEQPDVVLDPAAASAMSQCLSSVSKSFADYAQEKMIEARRGKLVRDKLDEKIPAEEIRIESDDARYSSYLSDKLNEELKELASSDFEDPDEFADVIEVLYTLAARSGVTPDMIEAARVKKLDERGGFARGLIYTPKEEG